MSLRAFLRNRRGSVAVMTAILLTPMLGAVALVTDGSTWLLEQHRLQIAADAAAHAAAMQLTNTAFQTNSPSAFATLVANEAKAATGGGTLIGTMATPTISVGSGYASVTVTLTSTADTFFASAIKVTAGTLHATATAGLTAGTCVLTLSPTGQSLTVGGTYGSGSIKTSGCSVFSNSSSSSAIYVSTTPTSINAVSSSIGTHGGYKDDKGCTGTSCFSSVPVTGATAQTDPMIAKNYALPSTGNCTYTNYTATAYKSTAYALQPGTYCGTTAIGGNGSTDTFAPGTYVFTGNVTINGANITQASGVTFVVTGATSSANAGTFTWTNNSAATLTAPTTGAYAGLLFWQTCASGAASGSNGNGLIDFNGGSTLTASGTVYAPCGTVQVDNNAQVTTASSSSFAVISAMLNVWQGASLQPASASSGSGGTQIALTQ